MQLIDLKVVVNTINNNLPPVPELPLAMKFKDRQPFCVMPEDKEANELLAYLFKSLKVILSGVVPLADDAIPVSFLFVAVMVP